MNRFNLQKVKRKYCDGCGNRKIELNMISFSYAKMPLYLCDDCKEEFTSLLIESE